MGVEGEDLAFEESSDGGVFFACAGAAGRGCGGFTVSGRLV